MPNRRFRSVAVSSATLLAFALAFAAPAESRVLQVDFTFRCPDATVCSCPGAAGNCFRFLTINEAMAVAVSGDSVLVRTGKYPESVALKNGVKLLGGYNAGFTTRNPALNPTMIYGGGTSSPITSASGVGALSLVDGFILTGAGGTPGAAVVVTGGAPVVRNNVITGNVHVGIAGGVYISGGSTARLENNVISDNYTQGSGGGVRSDSSSPTLDGNTIERNTARHAGGGIYAVSGSPVITNNIIRQNTAGDGGGGGAALQGVHAPAAVNGNDFIDNRGSFGGGVNARDQSVASFTGNDFSGNVASIAGGGLSVFNTSEVTLTSNRFVNCVAETFHGGGMYVFRSDATVTGTDPASSTPDASFVGCTTPLNGGGFYAFESNGVVSGVRFEDCEADSSGGAIHVARSLFTISENLIVDCVALEAGGVGILFNGSGILLQCPVLSNTIYGCTATGGDQFGGGMTVMGNGQQDIAFLAANLISHTRQGSALRCKRAPPGPTNTAKPTIACSTFHLDVGNTTAPSDIVGGTQCQSSFSSSGDNRIGDPLYCNALAADYRLQNCSPDVAASCPPAGTAAENRGAIQPVCGCGLTSIEETSWGRIKASYR